jgi:hypothetical protein
MKLFTYHSVVPQLSIVDETKLILLWQEHHRKLGYDPVVLNEYIARKHPKYEELCAKIQTLPSINPGSYDRACYLRWAALAAVGGGVMMDYDCFIYDPAGFKFAKSKTVCFQGHVPSLFSSPQDKYNAMVEAILNYQVTERDRVGSDGGSDTAMWDAPANWKHQELAGKFHVSDMYMLMYKVIEHDQKSVVKMYGEDGWETAPAVHYSTSTMTPAKLLPRWQHIPKLRK